MPTLEIRELRVDPAAYNTENGEHFILSFIIENASNVVCRTHFLIMRIPLKIRSIPVVIDDEQPPFTGLVSYYVDVESKSSAYVLEISGGIIYPRQNVRKAVRVLVAHHLDDQMNALCSRTEDNVSFTLFSDPPSKVKGQTQMPL